MRPSSQVRPIVFSFPHFIRVASIIGDEFVPFLALKWIMTLFIHITSVSLVVTFWRLNIDRLLFNWELDFLLLWMNDYGSPLYEFSRLIWENGDKREYLKWWSLNLTGLYVGLIFFYRRFDITIVAPHYICRIRNRNWTNLEYSVRWDCCFRFFLNKDWSTNTISLKNRNRNSFSTFFFFKFWCKDGGAPLNLDSRKQELLSQKRLWRLTESGYTQKGSTH